MMNDKRVEMYLIFDFKSVDEVFVFIYQCFKGGNDIVYFKNEDLEFVNNGDNSKSNFAMAAYSVLMGDKPKILTDYMRWKEGRHEAEMRAEYDI